VTRGPVHHVEVGPYWQRLLARLPFPPLRQFAGDPIHDIRGTAPNSVVFWTFVDETGRPPAIWSGDNFEPAPWRAQLMDEHGRAYSAEAELGLSAGSRSLVGWEAAFAPRRGRKLRLRIYQPWVSGGSKLVAELVTRNSWLGLYPTWRPELLPVTRQVGDLVVTLTSLVTGLKEPRSDKAAEPSDDPIWTRAGFHLSRAGKPIRDWIPFGITLQDATGNQLEWWGMDEYQRGDISYFAFEPSLCPDEPAWKLRVEFAPTPQTPIALDDQWMLRAVPFPRPRVFCPAHAAFSRHGATVWLLGVAGPHARLPDGSRSGPEAATVVLKSAQPLRGLWLVLFRAFDDHGRLIQTPTTMASGGSDYSFSLKPRAGAKRARLVFALPRSRFVEFTVHPSRP